MQKRSEKHGGRPTVSRPASTYQRRMPSMVVSMKFIVEIPDLEVFEAAEQPEDLACEIAELIASEILGFSSVTVILQQGPVGIHRVIQP